MRELKEETGYINCLVKVKIGEVFETYLDEYEENTYFQMTSYYYHCELLNDEKVVLKLDDYEFEQEFTPVWLKIDEAIEKNNNLLHQSESNQWIYRELFVLKELKSILS